MRTRATMAKPKDEGDLFSQPEPKKKKTPPTPPPAAPPSAPPAKTGKGGRVWLTNGFELPGGIDRTGLELGEPKAFRTFTVDALKAVGAVGIYRVG